MNKLFPRVTTSRIPNLLCCSAAVLLTACGGGADTGAERAVAPAKLMPTMQASTRTALIAAAPHETAPAATGNAPAADITTPTTSTTTDAGLVAAAAGSIDRLGTAPEAEASAKASAYHLYVATWGSDDNDGSQLAPFRTIGHAAGRVRPSTTVHVAPGTYRENVRSTVDGSAKERIRFVSEVKWGAKLIGSGSEAMWDNDASYTDISGFDISGSGRLGIVNWGSHTLVSGNHIHDITVSGGCTGNGGAGVVNANYSGSDGDIIGNVVHDIGVPGQCNGVQGIYSSNLRGVIMNNVVYRVSSYGIHLWHAADNVLIANNTVFANGSRSMGGGIVTGAGDSPGGIVLNNTRVINNIVYQNPGAGIKQYCYPGEDCIGDNNITSNNLVHDNGGGISLRKGSASATVDAEPEFASYLPFGGGYYALRAGSPAIDRGTQASAPSYDISGVQRRTRGAQDIGAYEY